MAKSKTSSANLQLVLGKFSTKIKLFRILVPANAPTPIITHSCRSEVSVVNRCNDCFKIVRITGVQKKGVARARSATEPKDKHCPHCKSTTPFSEVVVCGTCDTDVDLNQLEDRLQLGNQTVPITKDQLQAWQTLLPQSKVMRPVMMLPSSRVGSYFRDEAYEVVPDKGSAAAFALWLKYLTKKRQALIVHFSIKKNFKTGALYTVLFKSEPKLILHTLHYVDEVNLEQFDVPDVPSDLFDQFHDLVQPLRRSLRDPLILQHPQRIAFNELFMKGENAGKVEIKRFGALPGELEAVAKSIGERLAPPKKSRKSTKK